MSKESKTIIYESKCKRAYADALALALPKLDAATRDQINKQLEARIVSASNEYTKGN